MIRFGYFYLNGRLTVYDVCLEMRQGRAIYVASLSEDPRVCFGAVRAEHAVAQLREYLEGASAQRTVHRPAPTPRARAY